MRVVVISELLNETYLRDFQQAAATRHQFLWALRQLEKYTTEAASGCGVPERCRGA
jgi:hypothetical protein